MSDVSRIFPGNISHLRLIRLKEVFPFLSKLVSSVKVQSGAISCCWCHSTLSCFICWMSWRRGSFLNDSYNSPDFQRLFWKKRTESKMESLPEGTHRTWSVSRWQTKNEYQTCKRSSNTSFLTSLFHWDSDWLLCFWGRAFVVDEMAQRVFTCHEDLPAKLDMCADYCQRRGNDVCVSCICICVLFVYLWSSGIVLFKQWSFQNLQEISKWLVVLKRWQTSSKWRTQYTFARWRLPIFPRSSGRLRHISILI